LKRSRLVTTHLQKLTTGNNVFIVSVIVYCNCHILQFSHRKCFKKQVLALMKLRRTKKWCRFLVHPV